MKKILTIILTIVLILLIIIVFLRLVLPREIDDISPKIKCEQKYLKKADILWVIPNYKEHPISKNKTWCNYILNLNKTAGMHGIEHDYKEFKNNEISQENLSDTIQMFDECFKYKPSIFKAPQLMLSEKNRVLLEKNNLKIKGKINQVIHKVYHCSDTGTFPNYLHDLL